MTDDIHYPSRSPCNRSTTQRPPCNRRSLRPDPYQSSEGVTALSCKLRALKQYRRERAPVEKLGQAVVECTALPAVLRPRPPPRHHHRTELPTSRRQPERSAPCRVAVGLSVRDHTAGGRSHADVEVLMSGPPHSALREDAHASRLRPKPQTRIRSCPGSLPLTAGAPRKPTPASPTHRLASLSPSL